jgi:hypothetical protein
MGIDLRLPIGLLFVVLGALLVAVGLGGDRAIYARSLGINVNLWWGLALLVFGAIMLWVVGGPSWRGGGGGGGPPAPPPPGAPPPPPAGAPSTER